LEELLSGVAAGAPVKARDQGSGVRTQTPEIREQRAEIREQRSEIKRQAPERTVGSSSSASISPFGPSSGGWGTGPAIKQSAAPLTVEAKPVVERASVAPAPRSEEDEFIDRGAALAEPAPPAGPVAVVEPLPAMLVEPEVIEAAMPIATMAASPFPATSAPPMGFAETATDGALAKAPEPARAEGGPTVEALRAGVVAALAQNGHA